MPINKETIISVFDDKLTLMQWLKTINKALEDAVLTGVEITKKGNATLSFKFTFEDGTFLETNDIVLQQGESVNGAYIQNGHLYLTLTNDTNLDAGNVKPVSNFSIDTNQHLIVNYADGTSQDLGAIFNGDVNINGTLNATKVTGNEIVETMGGAYSFANVAPSGFSYENIYAGIVKNGNKLTLALALNITKNEDAYPEMQIGVFGIPESVANKLYPTLIGGANFLDEKQVTIVGNIYTQPKTAIVYASKGANNITINTILPSDITTGVKYYLRVELTFLLSNNLAQ